MIQESLSRYYFSFRLRLFNLKFLLGNMEGFEAYLESLKSGMEMDMEAVTHVGNNFVQQRRNSLQPTEDSCDSQFEIQKRIEIDELREASLNFENKIKEKFKNQIGNSRMGGDLMNLEHVEIKIEPTDTYPTDTATNSNPSSQVNETVRAFKVEGAKQNAVDIEQRQKYIHELQEPLPDTSGQMPKAKTNSSTINTCMNRLMRHKYTESREEAAMIERTTKEKPIKLGLCKVTWQKKLCNAKILARRINEEKTGYEYFVHRKGTNRRIDSWIPKEDITVCEVFEESDSDSNEDDELPTRIKLHFEDKLATECDDAEMEHKTITRIKYVSSIIFGNYEIDTWYHSLFPKDFSRCRKIYMCEFCLWYFKSSEDMDDHVGKCNALKPPGKVVYDHNNVMIFEIDGEQDQYYCQCLSLLGKFFIDHKALFFHLDPFLFYVLCRVDCDAIRVVGYFCKEKQSVENNNVSCIMVLPPYQKEGYGKLLITFSYEISRRQGVLGGPEKPLSTLGLASYVSYWSWEIINCLYNALKTYSYVTIEQLCEVTSMLKEDILSVLDLFHLTKYVFYDRYILIRHETISEIRNTLVRPPKIMLNRDKVTWEPSETTETTEDYSGE